MQVNHFEPVVTNIPGADVTQVKQESWSEPIQLNIMRTEGTLTSTRRMMLFCVRTKIYSEERLSQVNSFTLQTSFSLVSSGAKMFLWTLPVEYFIQGMPIYLL